MTPDNHTLNEYMLPVSDGHILYAQDWGNPKAVLPIIFLHGGPGSGCKDKYKQSFDPLRQRVIFFDQRGCGKSLPHGSLEHNMTQDLIADIEKLAKHFGLSKFILSGGSWGACLALAYALEHPARVHAMALTGIFTGTSAEIEWITHGGFRDFFPEVWQHYLDQTPKSHQVNPTAYHFKRALGPEAEAAKTSAYAYSNLESGVLSLDDRFTPGSFDEYDPAGSRIEIHYLANRCFLPDRYIMKHSNRLIMPIWLVQGRYDFVCPPHTAYELYQQLLHGELVWTVSGHKGERENWNVMRTILLQLTA